MNDDEIEKDIIRLAEVKKGNNAIPCFFILISERARPSEYVGENGNAVEKEFKRKDCKDLEYSTRVLKASSSFEKKENAYYCCLEKPFHALPIPSLTVILIQYRNCQHNKHLK